MIRKTRRQLTLFVSREDATNIEAIRTTYNPQQRKLIDCHVTLCREDEIAPIDKILDNLSSLKHKMIVIDFGGPNRFDDGKGVLIPAVGNNEQFQMLRQQVLKGLVNNPRRHEPHITLMHPRNATCTDTIFGAIAKVNLPAQLVFRTISLIEQVDSGKWEVLKTFDLLE